MNTQHIKLNIPLSFNQIVDIVKQLSPKESYSIPEEHKQIVRQRLKRMEEQPESCLTWEDIEHKIKL